MSSNYKETVVTANKTVVILRNYTADTKIYFISKERDAIFSSITIAKDQCEVFISNKFLVVKLVPDKIYYGCKDLNKTS